MPLLKSFLFILFHQHQDAVKDSLKNQHRAEIECRKHDAGPPGEAGQGACIIQQAVGNIDHRKTQGEQHQKDHSLFCHFHLFERVRMLDTLLELVNLLKTVLPLKYL